MNRTIRSRKPPEESQGALSKISKVFFGVDIFQVVVVVASQSSMIAIGNFNAYNNKENPGMGPGRRIYMIIFMAAVVYTCLVCLFAVKKKNFMEILAFVLQNFGFVTYSCIQVYHVGFKKYQGHRISNNKNLPKIAVTNTVVMLILNFLFIVLSYKLYIEFGWKIYKRVRFNLRLRSLYHIYQLLSCLLKMEILYWSMYALCNSEVLLKNSNNTALYYVNLAFIPLSVVYAVFGYKATQWENRPMMFTYLCWTLGGIGYFLYKLYGYISRKCTGCPEFDKTGKDIPEEAVLHFYYLASINLAVLAMLLAVGTKAFLNFGRGLGDHFKAKGGKEGTIDFRRFSHFIEESVISTASGDSVLDDLNESMRSEKRETLYHGALSAMAPLIAVQKTRINRHAYSKAASLPNLGGPASRRNSYPGLQYQNVENMSSSPTSPICEPFGCGKLAVIAEDSEEIASRPDSQIKLDTVTDESKEGISSVEDQVTMFEHKSSEEINNTESKGDEHPSGGDANGTTVKALNGTRRHGKEQFGKRLRAWIPTFNRTRHSMALNVRVKDYIHKYEQNKESSVTECQNPARNGNGSLALDSVTVEVTSNREVVTKVNSKLRTTNKESDR